MYIFKLQKSWRAQRFFYQISWRRCRKISRQIYFLCTKYSFTLPPASVTRRLPPPPGYAVPLAKCEVSPFTGLSSLSLPLFFSLLLKLTESDINIYIYIYILPPPPGYATGEGWGPTIYGIVKSLSPSLLSFLVRFPRLKHVLRDSMLSWWMDGILMQSPPKFRIRLDVNQIRIRI